jgi:SSS family solute:Na+ symporter
MLMKLAPLDFAILIAYFIAVLGVGYWLKDKMKTSSDFLLSKRSFSHWITGIASVVLSFLTEPPPAEKLKGLVYSGAPKEKDLTPWFRTPGFYAIVVLAVFIALNIKFF